MFDKFYKLYKRESENNDGLRKQLLEAEETASRGFDSLCFSIRKFFWSDTRFA